MTQNQNIIERVKELHVRCDSSSHLSEELDNALISPAELAYALITKDEQLKIAEEFLTDIENMPEYDQDDAHRLRDKAKRARVVISSLNS